MQTPTLSLQWKLVTVVTGVLLLAEQLGGAVVPTEQGPSPAPPALFREVGPSVDDWEKYLRNVAEDLEKQNTDTQRGQEENLFSQVLFVLFLKCPNTD